MSLDIPDSELFAKHIERMVVARKLSYMEAVIEFCEKRDLEPDAIVPFLSDKIKRAIGVEATRLHLVKPESELPFEG